MEKPKLLTRNYYNYLDAMKYCEEKYGFESRDAAGKYKKDPETGECLPGWEEREYLDFWHWIVDRYDIHNGCDFTLYRDDLEDEDEPEWRKTILGYLFTEFAAEDDYEIEFYVWW